MSVVVLAKRIVAVGILALFGTVAGAATVKFDFTGAVAHGRTMTFSAGALDLLVSAGRFHPVTGDITLSGVVKQTVLGLGERSNSIDDTNALDGNGPKELLQFSFNKTVKIESISFAKIASGSVATGFINGMIMGKAAVRPLFDVSGYNTDTDNFAIGASNKYSAFYVSGLTVSTIPLPAGGLLLCSALFGLSRLRRKRTV